MGFSSESKVSADLRYLVSPTTLTSAPLQVHRLQSELSQQYLLYREERDARKLLIQRLNDLRGGSKKEEHPAAERTGRASNSELTENWSETILIIT